MEKTIKVIRSDSLSDAFEPRYVVIDTETGEILDDAQGYGYKTRQKAYAGFAYKTRDKSKDKERKQREAYIRRWMKENRGFVRFVDQIALEIAKGSWGPDEKIDAKFIKKSMKDFGLETDIKPVEFLRIWKNS